MIDILEKLQDYTINTTTGCWEFNQARGKNRYGIMWIDGESYYVHRVVADLLIEPLNHSKYIHHICCNKSCINPDHLMVCKANISHSKIHRDLQVWSGRKIHL